MTYSSPTPGHYNPYTKCPGCGTKIWADHKKMREWGSMKLHHCVLYKTRKSYYNGLRYNPNVSNKYCRRGI